MKKLLLASACIAALASSCKEDDPITPDPIQFSLASTTVSNTGRASSVEIDAKIKFKNLENSAVTVRWERYDVNIPATWQVSVCDNEQCRVPSIDAYTMTIPANDSFDMKAVFYPNNEMGTGSIYIRMYDPADSARTVKSAMYQVEAN